MSGAEMLKKYKNGTLSQEEIAEIKKEVSPRDAINAILKQTFEIRMKNLFMPWD